MESLSFPGVISAIGYAIELVGVAIITLGLGRASVRYVKRYSLTMDAESYLDFRREIGRIMLVGLEFLVAGDIIRTVVVIDSILDVASLGLVVLIRTVLVFTIHLEVEGRWPWQEKNKGEQ